jgi:hypothetical protein
MEEFWQYVQRTGHPRKKTVQTDLPRQSTVESGTKPPKFSLIGSPCRIILVQRLFESIELFLVLYDQCPSPRTVTGSVWSWLAVSGIVEKKCLEKRGIG